MVPAGSMIAHLLEEHGYVVKSSDIVKRCANIEQSDFLAYEARDLNLDIITNPPYSKAT